MVQALFAHRAFDADALNQLSPLPGKLVETFKHKADDFSGNFNDDLKAILKISCRKLALTISH